MSDARHCAIVIERAEANYSAYVPDLPGCIAVGDTIADTRQLDLRATGRLFSSKNWGN